MHFHWKQDGAARILITKQMKKNSKRPMGPLPAKLNFRPAKPLLQSLRNNVGNSR